MKTNDRVIYTFPGDPLDGTTGVLGYIPPDSSGYAEMIPDIPITGNPVIAAPLQYFSLIEELPTAKSGMGWLAIPLIIVLVVGLTKAGKKKK